MQRRDFVKLPGALLQPPRADTLRLWTFSDAHVGTDKKRVGSEVRFIAVEKPGSVKTVSLAPERIEALLRAT